MSPVEYIPKRKRAAAILSLIGNTRMIPLYFEKMSGKRCQAPLGARQIWVPGTECGSGEEGEKKKLEVDGLTEILSG